VRARGERVIDGELADVRDVDADVVAFWNCFDQLADPAAALRDAHARLRDGGHVVIRVPNGDAYARLRRAPRALAPLARLVLATNNLLAFPYRFGFTPRSAARLFDRAGFVVQRIVGDTLVPIADRWTRPWARHEERLAKGTTRLLKRAGVVAPPWIEVYARKA
jgi:SAM-dependent methyltransferase